MSIVLSVVVVLVLVYFFRPQTFSFLKQGFVDEDFAEDPEAEGFVDEEEDKKEGFFACTDGVDEDGNAC